MPDRLTSSDFTSLILNKKKTSLDLTESRRQKILLKRNRLLVLCDILKGATTFSITTFSIMTLSLMGLVMTLSINDTQHRHSA